MSNFDIESLQDDQGCDEQSIQVAISICKQMGLDKEDAIDQLIEEFSVMEDEAESYVKFYW